MGALPHCITKERTEINSRQVLQINKHILFHKSSINSKVGLLDQTAGTMAVTSAS
jgi:hypothetical protein